MAFNKKQFKDLIERVLKEYDLYSPEAVDLLLGTAAVESQFGTYLRQLNGPAIGVFQMEPATFDWLQGVYQYRFKYLQLKTAQHLEYDLWLAILMARLRYTVDRLDIPKTLEGQAAYWKRVYNTPKGAGTEAKYLKAWERYVEA